MNLPDWITPSQREAIERGDRLARDDCADLTIPTLTDVTLDRGGGLDGRKHIAWCLICQSPATQCSCDHGAAAEALIEDTIDVHADVATVIAATREQLDTFTAAGDAMTDIAVAGDRL